MKYNTNTINIFCLFVLIMVVWAITSRVKESYDEENETGAPPTYVIKSRTRCAAGNGPKYDGKKRTLSECEAQCDADPLCIGYNYWHKSTGKASCVNKYEDCKMKEGTWGNWAERPTIVSEEEFELGHSADSGTVQGMNTEGNMGSFDTEEEGTTTGPSNIVADKEYHGTVSFYKKDSDGNKGELWGETVVPTRNSREIKFKMQKQDNGSWKAVNKMYKNSDGEWVAKTGNHVAWQNELGWYRNPLTDIITEYGNDKFKKDVMKIVYKPYYRHTTGADPKMHTHKLAVADIDTAAEAGDGGRKAPIITWTPM